MEIEFKESGLSRNMANMALALLQTLESALGVQLSPVPKLAQKAPS